MQIFKYQFGSNNKARAAERLLQQLAHVRLGSTIVVHIAHTSHVNGCINIMSKLGGYTISSISDYDLRELWKVRKPGVKAEFYFDQIV